MQTALVVASAALALSYGTAAAQCEGGVTVAGHYTPDGSYVPGGCSYTNPTTPGQLYPSGAQPGLSTNPSQGGSRLPGQTQPSDLIPVNSSDLGPAPSLVNAPQNYNPGPQTAGTTAGPGINVQPPPASMTGIAPGAAAGTTAAALPGQLPASGTPALTGNRAIPSSEYFPGQIIDPTGLSTINQGAYPGGSLPANPASPAVAPPMSTGTGQHTNVRVRIAEADESDSVEVELGELPIPTEEP